MTKAYRSSMVPKANSGGIQVRAAGLDLLSLLNTDVARGSWLDEGTAREPVTVLVAAAATAVYAGSKSWAVVIPVEAWSGGIASAILIGTFAGLMPAVRASRMPPIVALRTV
jgi:hypothetical protein